MYKILVTGGNGFLGKNILNSEIFKKYTIFAPSSKDLDLTNKKHIENFLSKHKIDWIINCAVRGGRRTREETSQDFYDNVVSLSNILEYINENTRLITFSSGAEIHKTDTFYGLSKKICTNLICGKDYITNIRIYNIFGRYGMKDSFVYSAIEKALKNEDIIIWENKKFDVYPVENLLKIINTIIEKRRKEYIEIDSVYYTKYTLYELAEIIKKECSSRSKIIIEKEGNFDYIGNPSEISDNTSLDNLSKSIYNLIDLIKNEKI
jgi:UDP-glucose 4-epimerase